MTRLSATTTTGWKPLRELARFEGRRLLRHPLFLAGVGFATIGAVKFVQTTRRLANLNWNDDAWTVSVGFLLLAMLTMIAVNYATLRDRRDNVGEQTASLPVNAAMRTGGLLLATLRPAAVSAVLLGAIAVYGASQTTLTKTDQLKLVAVIVIIVFFAAFGIALGTWLPNPYLIPVAAWALVFTSPGDHPAPWQVLAPIVDLRDASVATWHMSYQLGLAMACAAIALLKTRRSLVTISVGLIGVGVAVVSAVVMIPRACPATGLCRF